MNGSPTKFKRNFSPLGSAIEKKNYQNESSDAGLKSMFMTFTGLSTTKAGQVMRKAHNDSIS
jgi:hypothetical protein